MKFKGNVNAISFVTLWSLISDEVQAFATLKAGEACSFQSSTKTCDRLQMKSSSSTDNEEDFAEIKSDRRNFIAQSMTSLVATTSTLVSPPIASASEGQAIALSSSPLSPLAPVQFAASTGKITLPPLGLGAWAWGDTLFWGYDKQKDSELREVFDFAVENNLAFFDTAELYGLGRSESLLGQFRDASKPDDAAKVSIATKFAALPWRTKREDVVKACKASVKRLGGKPIDIYQIHFPNAWANANYWDGLADCYDAGLVRAVGVSNYGSDALRATHAALAKRGVPLATNQIQMSLLY
jgi:hypothetical protein